MLFAFILTGVIMGASLVFTLFIILLVGLLIGAAIGRGNGALARIIGIRRRELVRTVPIGTKRVPVLHRPTRS